MQFSTELVPQAVHAGRLQEQGMHHPNGFLFFHCVASPFHSFVTITQSDGPELCTSNSVDGDGRPEQHLLLQALLLQALLRYHS